MTDALTTSWTVSHRIYVDRENVGLGGNWAQLQRRLENQCLEGKKDLPPESNWAVLLFVVVRH